MWVTNSVSFFRKIKMTKEEPLPLGLDVCHLIFPCHLVVYIIIIAHNVNFV